MHSAAARTLLCISLTHLPSKYLLVPPGADFKPSDPHADDEQVGVRYSKDINRWTSPYMMSIINSKNVRRSVGLQQLYQGAASHFSPNFYYKSAMHCPNLPFAVFVAMSLLMLKVMLMVPPIRYIFSKTLAKSGTGPSAYERSASQFVYHNIAKASNGTRLGTTWRVVDPGYCGSGQMLVQTGLLLVDGSQAAKKQPTNAADSSQGIPQLFGFITPSAAFGNRLMDNLKTCNGFDISVQEYASVEGEDHK